MGARLAGNSVSSSSIPESFFFLSLTKENKGGNSPDRKENEGGENYVRLDPAWKGT